MTAATAPPRPARNGFYFWMAVYMLGCVVVGFGSAALTGNYNDAPPFPVYLTVHGLVLLAWFSFVVLQTALVRFGNVDRHRRIGIAGALIGVAVIATSPPAFLQSTRRLMSRGLGWDSDLSEFPPLGIEGMTVAEFAPLVVFSGIGNLVSFGVLLGCGLWLRRHLEVHKRLMLFASLAVFAPALARISRLPGLGGEGSPFTPIVFLGTLAAPLLHDKLTRGKVHPASWIALAWLLGLQLSLLAFGYSETGQALTRAWIG